MILDIVFLGVAVVVVAGASWSLGARMAMDEPPYPAIGLLVMGILRVVVWTSILIGDVS